MFGQNLNVILNNEKYIESVVGGSENAKKFKWNSQNKIILAVGVTIGAALAVCIASYGIVLLAGRLNPKLFYSRREIFFKDVTIPFNVVGVTVDKKMCYAHPEGGGRMQLHIENRVDNRVEYHAVSRNDSHKKDLFQSPTTSEHIQRLGYPAIHLSFQGRTSDQYEKEYRLPYQINSIEDVHNLYPELCGIKYTATSPLSNFLTKLPFVARVCQSSMESSMEPSMK